MALILAMGVLKIILSKQLTLSRYCYGLTLAGLTSDQQPVANCCAASKLLPRIQVPRRRNALVLLKKTVELCNKAHLA